MNASNKTLQTLIRTGDTYKFYASTAWRHKRKEALRRDHYECKICKDKGKHTKAKTVHHVMEIKVRPELALTLDNLMSVCDGCHNVIHDRNIQKETKKKRIVTFERWE